jgi:transcriptional regulator with PAS, ATPase and Fis domain
VRSSAAPGSQWYTDGVPRTKTRHPDVVLAPVLRAPVMRDLDRVLRLIAGKDVVLTLIGESGTGKEVFARRAHDLSVRRSGPFVAINCAAIPEALFESELFGHERGAFTGATSRAVGKIEAAAGGTLFLDEIGEMPLLMQAKLLRFLENRRFMRVGGHTKIDADVRMVCATLRPLEQEVAANRFRADLFYRIQGITLAVPPLRRRPADIPPLIDQFMAQASARHGVAAPDLPRSIRAALLAYPWPGNVRELRNTIDLLCLLRSGKKVRTGDLPDAVRTFLSGSLTAPTAPTLTLSLDEPLEAMIDRIIECALSLEAGNRTRAARRLGVSVRTIQRRLVAND